MKSRLLKILILALCISFALFAVSCKKNKKESAKESVTQSTVESVVESDSAPESGVESETALESIIESDVESDEESETESQEESETVHECDYTELKCNSTHHWYECTCGAKDSSTEQAHAGGTATCKELAECATCGQAYGLYGAHNMVDGECSICGKQESQGLKFELSADRTYYTVVGIGTCNDTDLIIPTTYQDKPVTSIGEDAFGDCDSLTSVVIPDSVTSIGEEAFRYCDSLTSVYYTGEIEDWCNITFGGDYANPLRYGVSLYINNVLITELVIPNTVTEIKAYAFYKWTWLTSVVIPESVTSIGDYAFSDCTSLTSVVIPDSVTSIGWGAFEYCYSLTSVVIGDGVTSIGDLAFFWCDSLTSVVIGDGVTSIGYDAFYYCDSLTSIEVGENNTAYKSIDGNLYSKDGTELIQYAIGKTDSEFIIPDSVTSIGDGAFHNCDSLTSVEIPDSVTSIGNSAFYSCSSLTSVYYTGEIEDWCNITFRNSEANPLYNGASLYINNEIITELVIPNTVTEIKSYAFYNCDSLTSVVIGDNVTSIGRYAFKSCYSLTSVIIPDSVTSIGYDAFRGCGSLTSIEVSENNTAYKSIDGNLYSKDGTVLIQYATGKTDREFVIPNSVASIGYEAFYNSDSLTSVVIGESVTSIGGGAFRSCVSLTSVVIGDGVTSIGEYAFYGCYKLVEVINNSSHITVEKGSDENGYVGYYALSVSNCDESYVSKLSNDNGYIVYTDGEEKILVGYNGTQTDLVLPDYITKINQYAFYNSDSLTSVVIPDSVTSIGDHAFYNCYSLTSVVIGDGVTSIDRYAFSGCNSLTSVVIGGSVTSIGNYAFDDCYSLTSVYYKGTSSEWSSILKGSDNSKLTIATRYYYIENEADVPTEGGNYWHYVDGVPTVW